MNDDQTALPEGARNGDQTWTPGTDANAFGVSEQVTAGAGAAAAGVAGAAGGGSGRKGWMVAAAAAGAVALIGGGGYLAYSSVLGGGGAQPESVLPANAVAFAKVDLDPSGTQKIDALRFLRKLPDAPEDTKKDDADLRKVIFDQIAEKGGLEGIDYAKDVEPWLGERFAVAALPGADASSEPVPVIALAITDADAAKAGLAKIAKDKGYCTILDEYALCGEEQGPVDAAAKAGASASLESSDTFAKDWNALGEKGIASYWVDGDKAEGLIKASGEATGGDMGLVGDQVAGRTFGALRFDGANLELSGKQVNGKLTLAAGKSTTVGALPADTLAAFGFTGGGDLVKKQWAEVTKDPEAASSIQEFASQSGFSLPGDLQTLFGSSFAIAFGGMGEDQTPQVALVTDSQQAQVQTLVDKVADLGLEMPLKVAGGEGKTVVALTPEYADAVKSGSGLADSEAFKSAVPDASNAQVVLFANVSGLVQKFGTDMSAEDRKLAEVFSGVGFSATSADGGLDYRLRVATK